MLAAHDAPDAHFPCRFCCSRSASPRASLAPRALAFEQPEGESGFQPKPLVTAKKHMVVAAHPLAAEAGLAILRKGGSAVDAGIAVQMVLNLVEPQSSGIGGGGYILYWDAGAKQLASIDGRETAPAGRHARALPRCGRQAAAARRGHGERAFGRRARRARGAEARP